LLRLFLPPGDNDLSFFPPNS